MLLNLGELDNTNNLENGKPSNTLLAYHVTACDDSTHLNHMSLSIMKLKNSEIISLALRIKHMKNKIINDGPATTVVLHICDWFFLSYF